MHANIVVLNRASLHSNRESSQSLSVVKPSTRKGLVVSMVWARRPHTHQHLPYSIKTPPGAKKTIAWVGKGIVYDTGGLSLKDKVTIPYLDLGYVRICVCNVF